MHIRDAISLNEPFFLRQKTYGEHPSVPIEEHEFHRIWSAKQILIAARSIEERYDASMENYIEFEKAIASACINEMVRGDYDYDDVYIVMRDLNIRISTLLSAAQMYVDHLAAVFAAFSRPDWDAPAYLKQCVEKQRADKHHRLGEGIRNYAQHVEVPISNAVIGGKWRVSKGKKITSYHAVQISASKKDLSRKRKLARDTLSEFDDEIDVKYVIGKYIHALGSLHREIREVTASAIEESRQCFEGHIESYARLNECCGSPTVLTAIRVEKRAIAEEIQIHLNWDDVRQRLIRRNRDLRDLSVCYATTISPTVLKMEARQAD